MSPLEYLTLLLRDARDWLLNRPRFEVVETTPHGLPPVWGWRLVRRGHVYASVSGYATEDEARKGATAWQGTASNADIETL